MRFLEVGSISNSTIEVKWAILILNQGLVLFGLIYFLECNVYDAEKETNQGFSFQTKN